MKYPTAIFFKIMDRYNLVFAKQYVSCFKKRAAFFQNARVNYYRFSKYGMTSVLSS
jgi:hypothetical protein